MNKTLTLSQLEVSLGLLQQEHSKLEFVARLHKDPATREEARQAALVKSREIDEVAQQIDDLRTVGIS